MSAARSNAPSSPASARSASLASCRARSSSRRSAASAGVSGFTGGRGCARARFSAARESSYACNTGAGSALGSALAKVSGKQNETRPAIQPELVQHRHASALVLSQRSELHRVTRKTMDAGEGQQFRSAVTSVHAAVFAGDLKALAAFPAPLVPQVRRLLVFVLMSHTTAQVSARGPGRAVRPLALV
jgi:hypothetical protein